MNDQRIVYVGLLEEVVAFCEFWKQERGLSLRDKVRATLSGPGVEPVASNTKAAGEAIELVFDERNWPANPVAAARCGWEACLRTNTLYLAAPSAPVQAVPDGWQVVPKTITLEMQHAYFKVIDNNMERVKTDCTFGRYRSNEEAYRAMLAAAPQPPRR